MAIRIPSASEIAAKFARVTPGRSDDYSRGVQALSPADFEAAAITGEASYAQALTQSIAAKRRVKGLQGSGPRWQRKSIDLGVGRYASGTAGAAQDYEQGFAPFQQVIAGLTLPARGPAGDPKNIERVRAIADALRRRKVGT